MDDKKKLADERLDDVNGGALADTIEKKGLIRSLYDAGSVLEKKEEDLIVNLEKAVADRLHKK